VATGSAAGSQAGAGSDWGSGWGWEEDAAMDLAAGSQAAEGLAG